MGAAEEAEKTPKAAEGAETKEAEEEAEDQEENEKDEEDMEPLPPYEGDSEEEEEEDVEDEDESSDEELPLGSLEAPVQILEGKRNRKESKKYMPSDYSTPATQKGKKNVEIPQGKGVVLTEHPVVMNKLYNNQVTDLKTIHKLLYSQNAEFLNKTKVNIRLFNGWSFEEGSKPYNLKKKVIQNWTTANLKWAIDLFDVQNAKGKKDDMVNGFMEWLMCPKPSGKEPKSKKTPKKSPKKTATKRKSSVTPKTPAKKSNSTPSKASSSAKKAKTTPQDEKIARVNLKASKISAPKTPTGSSKKANTTSKTKV